MSGCHNPDCKILERIEKLESLDVNCFAFAFNDSLDKVYKRIEALENEIKKLHKRVKSIGRGENDILDILSKNLQRIEALEDRHAMPHVAGGRYPTIPHKCAVCDGYGKRQWLLPDSTRVDESICIGCEGKGIVWG